MSANAKKSKQTISNSFFQKKFHFTDYFMQAYNTPNYWFNIYFIRFFVSTFLAFKILSREFEFFGYLPEQFFYFYPIEIYFEYMLFMGIPGISELATFHWIHFFLPHPAPETFSIIKLTAASFAMLYAIAGAGKYKWIATTNYILVMYLWGYIYLAGQDIDATFLYQGILLVLLISSFKDKPLWQLDKKDISEGTAAAGRIYSHILMVFILYYFTSGINKIIDISITDWFNFGLIETIHNYLVVSPHSNIHIPEFFAYITPYPWLNYLIVPAVYISHLFIPVLFFKRRTLIEFAIFYSTFHLAVMGVGIAFTGYVFIWGILFDYSKLLRLIFRLKPTLTETARAV